MPYKVAEMPYEIVDVASIAGAGTRCARRDSSGGHVTSHGTLEMKSHVTLRVKSQVWSACARHRRGEISVRAWEEEGGGTENESCLLYTS
eukprot:3095454-Rhodomonas_salina.1